MPSQNNTKITIKKENCKIKFPNINELTICTVLWFQDKTVEFSFQSLNNKKILNFLEKSQILQKFSKIQLNLNYRVQLKRTDVARSNLRRKQYRLQIIIKNYKNLQRISIQHPTLYLKSQEELFHSYFSGFVWIKGVVGQKYELLTELDKNQVGSESQFIIIKDKKTHKKYFVKQYLKRQLKNRQGSQLDITSVVDEVYFQNIVKHANIMRFNYFFDDPKYLFLFFTQRPVKILYKHIDSSGEVSSGRVKGILRQLLKAIDKLYQAQILHNNLRSSSVFLIERNGKWKVSLGEFQNACRLQHEGEYQTLKQKSFLAPQLIKNNIYAGQCNGNSDVFSLAVLFYDMLFKKDMFKRQLYRRIQNQQIDFQTIQFSTLSQKCLDLFKKMIDYNPYGRISAYNALNHEYFIKADTQIGDEQMNSMKSNSSNDGMDQMISQIYQKRLSIQNEKIRQRYYAPFIQIKPMLNDSNSFDSLKVHQVNEGAIPQQLMDDKHNKFQLKDARIMKPAWRRQRQRSNI